MKMKRKMGIFSLFSLTIFIIVSLAGLDFVRGNSISNSNCGGILEGDSGEFEYHRENGNVDDLTGSSVCIWMIKLLTKEGTGVNLKLEDLDENSLVNLYSEGEPTDPVNTPITLNSSQINSAVELSGRIFIITLKSQSQIGQFENSPTKFVVSWTFLEQSSTADSNSNGSKILPVEFTSTNYFAGGGEKGRYNFKNLRPLQKSVWILDAGFGGSLDAEVNVQFDSSCLSKFKSLGKSDMTPKVLCDCSYFGLFQIVPSSGKLRLVNDFCGGTASSNFPKLSTQLVVFIYTKAPDYKSGESLEIRWERNKETTNPTTTTTTKTTSTSTSTESPKPPEPPIKASLCPESSLILPCTCSNGSTTGVHIKCSGPAVQQTSSIANAFREIRQVNQIPEDREMSFSQFQSQLTELTQLDLAPFYGSRMGHLGIETNYNLTKLTTSGNPTDHGSIHLTSFQFTNCPINRDGFGDALKYFSDEMMSFSAWFLSLSDHNMNININSTEEEGESEFLPGLSALTNLTTLHLSYSEITGHLTSKDWNFKGLSNLQLIDLSFNQINGIGEHVFDFDVKYDLEIRLDYTELNETSFHPNSGIAKMGRRTILGLMCNQFTTLPAQIFESFLDAHPENVVLFEVNPLVCDERLSWIKARREEFQRRVDSAVCANDPGYDVFSSDLIP